MTVVVGIESATATAPIRLAAQEARYRGCPLVAVASYSTGTSLGAPAAQPVNTLRSQGDNHAGAQAMLNEVLTATLGSDAEDVIQRAMPGTAGRGIVTVAEESDAQLIVVAGRGWSALAGQASQQYVLRRAPCPVLVVPADGKPARRPSRAPSA